MDVRSFAKIMTLSLLAAAPWAMREGVRPAVLDASEVRLLAAADDGSLDGLRAGNAERAAGLGADECAALNEAAAADPDLELLRGGDIHLTDREIKLVLITVAVVLVVAVIV